MNDGPAFGPGQAMVAPGMPEGQFVRGQAHQVKDRRVQIAEVNLPFHGLGAGGVGLAVDVSAFTPPPASQKVKPR
ncbi:MAG: hypothetical protein QM767_01775 [Anaeromyxobacter sp.]